MDAKLFADLSTGCFEHRLFAFMNSVGLKRINVEYSGGGDSGGVDQIEFQPHVDNKIEDALSSNLEEELASPIYNRHGSFADGGGYYVNGHVVYRADEKTVWISGVDHITEYEAVELDDPDGEEDYEENSREEEWEECLFPSDTKLDTNRTDFFFVYMYAKHVLKNKLPEEFHNRMLAEAATQNPDESAVEYVKELK